MTSSSSCRWHRFGALSLPHPTVATLLLLSLSACRSAGPSSDTSSRGSFEQARQERSVRPGINEPYEDADLDKWIGRFEAESREIFRHRQRIVDVSGVEPGAVVADIGAGTGLFVPLLSRAVDRHGKVLAVEIVPEFLDHIRERAKADGLRNVQTVLCAEDSVMLPPGSIDLAFVCDTYHHFEYPRSTLSSIHRALRRGGVLIIIDFDRIEGHSRQWVIDHVRAGKELVTAEIVEAGFVLTALQPDDSFLEENYILRFQKAE